MAQEALGVIDIEASSIRTSMVTPDGLRQLTMVSLDDGPLYAKEGPFIGSLNTRLNNMPELARINSLQLRGVGIAVSGSFDYAQGEAHGSPLDIVRGLPLRQLLFESERGIPLVFVPRDAATAKGASLHPPYPGANVPSNVLSLFIGNYPELGIVRNGNASSLDTCMDQIVEGSTLRHEASPERLLDMYDRLNGLRPTTMEMVEMAAHSEPVARMFQAYGANIGDCLNQIVDEHRPDIVVVSGPVVSDSYPCFWPGLTSTCRYPEQPQLLVPSTNEHLSLFGAAALAAEQLKR